jgi:hypothetical protein
MDHPKGRKTVGHRKIHWVLKKRLEAQKPSKKPMVWHILGIDTHAISCYLMLANQAWPEISIL